MYYCAITAEKSLEIPKERYIQQLKKQLLMNLIN